jgi:hypothetical protein
MHVDGLADFYGPQAFDKSLDHMHLMVWLGLMSNWMNCRFIDAFLEDNDLSSFVS